METKKIDFSKLNISRVLIVDDAETFDIDEFLEQEKLEKETHKNMKEEN